MKTIVKYLCFVVMVLLLISCAGGSKGRRSDKTLTLEDHFQLGFNAAERGNLEEAVSEYKKVLKMDPKHSRARLNLGIVYARQGKWKEEI